MALTYNDYADQDQIADWYARSVSSGSPIQLQMHKEAVNAMRMRTGPALGALGTGLLKFGLASSDLELPSSSNRNLLILLTDV